VIFIKYKLHINDLEDLMKSFALSILALLTINSVHAWDVPGDIICKTKDWKNDEKVLITLRTVGKDTHVATIDFPDQGTHMFVSASGAARPERLNITFEYGIGTLVGNATGTGVYSNTLFTLKEAMIQNLNMRCQRN
jgi:hypothetical protein